VIKDIEAMYKAQGKSAPKEMDSTVYYNRGVLIAALHVEAVRNAIKAKAARRRRRKRSRRHGADQGLHPGGLVPPMEISSSDHEGGGWVQIWTVKGGKLVKVKDWFQGNRPTIQKHLAADASNPERVNGRAASDRRPTSHTGFPCWRSATSRSSMTASSSSSRACRSASARVLSRPAGRQRRRQDDDAQGHFRRAAQRARRGHKGAIQLGERRIDGMRAHDVARLGLVQVFEGRRVFENLTTEENLIAGGHVQKDGGAVKQGIELVYSYFPKLKERRHQQSGYLSGGEQQMLAIGRALMSQPGWCCSTSRRLASPPCWSRRSSASSAGW